MNMFSKVARVLVIFILFAALHAQTNQKATLMPTHATGPFDVKITPINDKSPNESEDTNLGRMRIDKQYHGDLEATAKGQMLTAGSPAKRAGGYVAMESVSGTLNGRTGSFVLQHSGTMTSNARELTIAVVPESGTGQLEGITGKMNINIAADGKHSYDFEYTLPSHN